MVLLKVLKVHSVSHELFRGKRNGLLQIMKKQIRTFNVSIIFLLKEKTTI